MNPRTIPVYLAFLCMGFGDAAAPLTSQLQEAYNLSDLLSGLVPFVGFIMFGFLSIPMGIYQDRKGKKHVLFLGLSVAFIGLLLPIIGNFSSFWLLLAALLLLGSGATMLQVSGNPIMRDVSAEGKYSRNLSFGQFIKAIGSLSAAVIPLAAFHYWGLDWKLLFPVYAVIIFIAALFLLLTPIKEKKEANAHPATFTSCFNLLFENKLVALAVLGIFLFVGAEVSISAKLPNYLAHKFNFDIKELGLWGTTFFLLAIMTGRFMGGVVLTWLSPHRFLSITGIISIIGVMGLFFATNELMGFVFIFITGLGFANIFPLIFSITIDMFPHKGNEISGLMVTAITGGAIVPLIFGLAADGFGFMTGFVVPLLCILYIVALSFKVFGIQKIKA